jgi:hypothetical protein
MFFDPEDGGSTFFENDELLPYYMASHPRRQYFLYAQL